MGRAFEFRKERKMKRWAGMAKTFTRIGREIAIAVKSGGADPHYNPSLRMAINNAKNANMPKANVDAAIKRASSKDAENYQEVIYEGYGPNKVAFIVETATDNPTRTVATVRMHFSRNGGEIVESGTHNFIFSHKGVIKINPPARDLDELELLLIDYGLESIKEEDDDLEVTVDFSDYGTMLKGLEESNIEVLSAEAVYVPTIVKKVSDEQAEAIIKLIDKLEEEDDITNVFHNMDMSDD
ncbi:MAG: YebC/PmpR family DNA-binding transcriptional regulator [Saprospiraceae bacterium]|jgi:YebC/PmpR family DNA-binding regulatory protein|nr:YebC/PmpR family DNA-binding transcriptional regulator [Saprospiraceae bacterium]MCA0332499.1 YebC/PmpR family DNA-binding transcriptional regulator [Bacteroidota bacterium]MCB0603296.1 YebC/PmpR family DNA-binding transcriptional regulator [Saprospiraceae bacterium]MCO5276857.1 YebC/PmpR family DNA-binding transcriptional regulator [Saprospiraceae bacterium]HMT76227.1 YebC/PmpR family DNA-binding transcriptional regulator [Saprospiraceae bacterium]